MESQEDIDIDQRLADAGWELDDSFSEHLLIGHDGDISIQVDLRSWDGNDLDGNNSAYELYDADLHLSYWVKEIPTPKLAAALLK